MTNFVQILMTPVMVFALFVPRPLGDCGCCKKQSPEKKAVVRSCCGSHGTEPEESQGKSGKCSSGNCRDCMASCCVKLVVALDFDNPAVHSSAVKALAHFSNDAPANQTLRGVFHPPRA